MKVSVILPVFNGEQTLKSTLDSLVAQTFEDFEVIACIDGTKDHSKQILEGYVNFKRLTIIENEFNLGIGSTMNRLVAQATGLYIAVAEQDDFYYPDRLKLQVDLLDSNKEIGLVSGISEFSDGQKIVLKFPGILDTGDQYPVGKAMFLYTYREQIKVVNSCMMFRKSIHIDHGLYFSKHYPNISVDWSYILRFSLISNIYGIHEALVKMDRSRDRQSVTNNKEIQFLAARELIRSFAYEYPDIITKQDYSYALATQYLLEINQAKGINFLLKSIKYIMLYPNDKRFIKNLWRRYGKKMNNLKSK